MDTITSNYYWHAKVSTICLVKRSEYISCCTLQITKNSWHGTGWQCYKKCKQEFYENKDIATETTKCIWQIINTVKLSLKTISVLQWNSHIINIC